MNKTQNTPEEKNQDKNIHYSNPLIRFLLIIMGSFFVALGIAGIILPVLPATPFLLLAAALYARSSAKFYHWLMHNRWFGDYIRNYRAGHGIPVRAKIIAISMLWLSIGSSVIFAIENIYIRILLIVIAIGVTAHLIAIKTKR
jgi:hypothetical protein